VRSRPLNCAGSWGLQPSLLQHWKRHITDGARVAVTANEDVVPVSELKAAQQRIKELERVLGRKMMEVEISRMPCIARLAALQAARDTINKSLFWYAGCAAP
jgi:transposase-like protein